MIKINFTAEDQKALHYERYHHKHPRVRQKMEALYFKSLGYSHKEIIKLVGISKPTFVSYLKDYKEGGIEKLKILTFHKPEGELTQYKDLLADYFKENPPKTLLEATEKIKELTGIERSRERVRKFLINTLGLRCRRVGVIPSKADPVVQDKFLKEELEPRLEEAKKK
jgi:transposase